ncbi:YybH family protein [Aliihoeflea sp. PC F10.4]
MIDDENQILDLLRAREDAVGRADAEAALASFEDDVLVFDLPPPLQYRGADAKDADELRAWFETWESGVVCHLHEIDVTIEGKLAVVTALQNMKGMKRDLGAIDQWSRTTIVLRHTDNGWLIVHEHNSFPLMMDGSGLAATGLTP